MCRLLGYAAHAATTVDAVLGGDERRVFTDMARLHRDGWGTAWHDAGGALRLGRRPTAGTDDAALAEALTAVPATARLVHLRLATRGMACELPNTHPFTADGTAFAHNGSLEPTRPIERLLSPRRRAELTGTTDSERYFAAIRTAMDAGLDALDATAATARALRDAYPRRSLNALLLTPRELIAVHASRDVPIPLQELTASGLPAHLLPRHHVDAYYLMRMHRAADGSVAVASSGLDVAGWDPLPEESVVRIDLATLAVTTVPLASAQALVA